jgi:hypothetical protein
MSLINLWKPGSADSCNRRWVLTVGALGLVTLGQAGNLRAADAETEVRTFAVTVDGKAAGTYTLTVATDGEGKETVTAVASVKVKQRLITYTYESRSVEVWKKGQLVTLEAATNDNGKKLAVRALSADGKLTVTAGGTTRKIDGDVLTTAGIRPPAADKARDAALFDSEDGTETAVRVEPLGACRVALNGQIVEGTRFKLTGKGVATEWWFDKNGRAIRQEMKWDGHSVVFALAAVGR